MPGFDICAAFFATALLLALAPGPDNIFVLAQSALYGAKAGIFTTFGLVTGLCAQTLAVALGVAVIFQTSPLAFNLLKICGAAYLCWLAWLSFRAGASSAPTSGAGAFPGYGSLYTRGIIMNITNPKVCLFFLAFLPQFCSPGNGPMIFQIICFGVLFIAATLIVFCPVAALGGTLARWFNKSAKAQIIMNRLAAMIFLGLAGILVFIDK